MKENPVLTTQELSKYLKLNQKTILRMAQSGELPGFKIANQWRFYLSALDEYLQNKIGKSSTDDFSKLVSASDLMSLSRLVEQPYINMALKSETRDSLLYELTNIAQASGITSSSEEVFKQLQKREAMLSTAVGNGIAIPHPRNPSDELFNRPGVIIARSIKGIEFLSPDQKKVHLFFMVCAPDVILHLRLLSKIAKLLKGKHVFKKFMTATSKDEIIKILLEHERFNIRTSG
ncbi:MAG: PTS sugar transporter subunit IIA [Candidatus Omnitrophota bacterium]